MACKACNELCRLNRITSFSVLRVIDLTVVSLIGWFRGGIPLTRQNQRHYRELSMTYERRGSKGSNYIFTFRGPCQCHRGRVVGLRGRRCDLSQLHEGIRSNAPRWKRSSIIREIWKDVNIGRMKES